MTCSGVLHGKVIVVTGSNRGIGRAIVEESLQQGSVVVACARNVDALQRDELFEDEAVFPVCLDLNDQDSIRSAAMQIKKRYGKIDALVNNAGRTSNQRLGYISEEEMSEVFKTNVFGLISLSQYIVRLMPEGGSIVNLSSIVGQRGNPGQIVYSASKGAVVSLTKSMAKELGPRHIRVNAVAPGLVDTDAYRSVDEALMQDRLAGISMGRIGTPQDVARCCAFLCSEASSYISGEVIGVNGCSVL